MITFVPTATNSVWPSGLAFATARRPIDPAATYRIAINNFVASGGDGYPKVTAHPSYRDTGFVDADVLRAYIAANSPLKAADYAPGDQVVRR